MIVYISGRITGDDRYREKFADAESVLRSLGHIVLNPTIYPEGLDYEQYMYLDNAMVDICDTVVLLPDWRQSKGAKRERRYAVDIGKRVEQYQTFVDKEMEGARA